MSRKAFSCPFLTIYWCLCCPAYISSLIFSADCCMGLISITNSFCKVHMGSTIISTSTLACACIVHTKKKKMSCKIFHVESQSQEIAVSFLCWLLIFVMCILTLVSLQFLEENFSSDLYGSQCQENTFRKEKKIAVGFTVYLYRTQK